MTTTAQPTAPREYRDWDAEAAREAVKDLAEQPGSLLEALHRIQDIFGHVSDDAIILLADVYNLTRAEVYGVVTFYHDFRRNPGGQWTIRVCQAEACQSMGSEQLTEAIKEQLGIGFHGTTEDGQFNLEPVYCLGNCACSPNIMIDNQVHARMTPDRFKSLLSTLTREAN